MTKSVILTVCLAIVALSLWGGVYAQKTTYQSFAEGPRLDAIVAEIGQKTIAVSFDDASGQHHSSVYSEPLSDSSIKSFHVGDHVRITHPAGNPMRIMPESVIDELLPSSAYLRTVQIVALAALLNFIWTMTQSIRRKRLKTGWDVMLWSLSRTRNINLSIGFLLLVFGVFVAWLAWHDSRQSPAPALWQSSLLFLLAVICCAIGGWALFRGLSLFNIKKSPLYEKLTSRFSEIVWIYEMTASVKHAEVGKEFYVMVGFLDGSLEQIAVEKKHVPLVIQSITQKAPQARLGYSKELSDLFHQNPAAVQKSVQQ